MREEVGTEPIIKELRIDATPETVFAFFTDPEKLTRWLCDEATVDARPGGVNHQTHPGDAENPNGPYQMRGRFLEVSPPSRVVFTWGFENPYIRVLPGASTVEVTLEPDGDGTRLRLVHRDLPESERDAHAGGWDKMLARLATVAPGGDPREENMNDNSDSVTTTRAFDASPSDVFDAWTTPDSLRLWLADVASTDPRPGGRWRLEGRVPDGQVYVMNGEYREFVPGRRLVTSWIVEGPGGAADRVETLVTVEFRETGSGGTEMGFREEYVEEEYTVDPDAEAAWTAAFDGLEALLGAPAKEG